jgi:hypothetical protein
MIIGKVMRKSLEGLGYAAELVEYDVLSKKSAGHQLDPQIRAAEYQKLKAVLKSGVAKPVEQKIGDTTDKTLELVASMAPMLADLHKVVICGEPLEGMGPGAVRAASRHSKAAWTTRVEAAKVQSKEDEANYYQTLAKMTQESKEEILAARNEVTAVGKRIPTTKLRQAAKAATSSVGDNAGAAEPKRRRKK